MLSMFVENRFFFSFPDDSGSKRQTTGSDMDDDDEI